MTAAERNKVSQAHRLHLTGLQRLVEKLIAAQIAVFNDR
jgi:hypothetical protein